MAAVEAGAQLAQAGSRNPQKLDGALARAREIVKAKL